MLRHGIQTRLKIDRDFSRMRFLSCSRTYRVKVIMLSILLIENIQ